MILCHQAEETVDEPGEPEPPKKTLSQSYKEFIEKNVQDSEAALQSRKSSALTNIKREMTLYESSGNRGRMLEQIYTALLSIPPTSVEAERIFSAAGLFMSKVRTRLNDESMDSLCILRSHFKTKYKKK